MTSTFTPPAPRQTAVLFLVFNRPDTTAQVFEAIRQAKPPRLYVSADSPREGRAGEAERVAKVREIATAVDWPCELRTLFREENLGCKYAVSNAITWFFEQEEQGVILEDDCLPHPDFFTFCETLLNRYVADERVSVITGNNFQQGQHRGEASYYFSKYNHCWGWASWRRAWQHYQGDLPFWPTWSASGAWARHTPDKVERRYWEKIFDRVRAGQIDSWAYPWTASVWCHGGLTATPNVNLVSNIGFGEDSTHTSSANSPLANLPVGVIGNFTHPQRIEQDNDADRFVADQVFGCRYRRFPRSFINLPRRLGGRVCREFNKLAKA
ncbi:glycosyltransferase family 2 protein [Spiribacter salinus]|uniref:glycosyltransferase family 2 protein n=1 Tax=Spiribacter salinus TaxID=1335746 RepID=UPI001C96C6B1|nr:glycosyltransferase family 2 protein [Spiribacter salinus]MBY5267709.1 hemolytic protein HlpA-like protein [Spiribacter salinus]